MPSFDLRPCSLEVVIALCEAHHGYKSAGRVAAYAFAVYENDRPVAAFAWQPPPLQAAISVCPEAPYGVLALSRMVAVPKTQRRLKHISKPLKVQMRRLIDRTRWPVLVTYSDEGQGHTGYVYKCSGWEKTTSRLTPVYTDGDGRRVSSYRNGVSGDRALIREGSTTIQRWEDWACERGDAAMWMEFNNWRRVPVEGKTWRSGGQAYQLVLINDAASAAVA